MPQQACSCPSISGVSEAPGGGSITSVQQKCESSGRALQQANLDVLSLSVWTCNVALSVFGVQQQRCRDGVCSA